MSRIIEIENLSKRFKKYYVFKNANFLVNKGELVILVGENGSGKSTLIKLILKQIRQTKGKIKVNVSKIFYLPESFALPDNVRLDSIFEAYCYYYKTKKEDYHEIIQKYGLVDHLKKLIKDLSKGTRQKVALTVANLANADLVILDEPITGLDESSKNYILDFIFEMLNTNKTVILSTHFISTYSKQFDAKIYKVGEKTIVPVT